MTYPERVRVGHYTYTVTAEPGLRDDAGDPCYGMYHTGDQTIRLDAGLTPERLAEAFWHEALHVIAYERDVPLREKHVRRLARGLTAFLAHNPGLVIGGEVGV